MAHTKYVFIDESGDLGMKGSDYFIMAMIVIDDEQPLEKIVKRTRQRKLRKKNRKVKELKANNNRDEVRKYVLSKLADLDCQIYAIVVKKAKILSRFYDIPNIFYNYVSRILITEGDVNNTELHIIIDKKYNNSILRNNFNGYVVREVESRKGVRVKEIIHGDSEAHAGLQCVDFVAWAISRKFNYDEDRFYKIIEPKILNRRRMKLWE